MLRIILGTLSLTSEQAQRLQLKPRRQLSLMLERCCLRVKNLEKVGGSLNRLAEARSLLWQGKVNETIALFEDCQLHQARCFCQYLHKHRHRIPNYDYLKAENICSIGSSAIESTIKQIDRRLQISGARWKPEHISAVLAHRCAYLNNQL